MGWSLLPLALDHALYYIPKPATGFANHLALPFSPPPLAIPFLIPRLTS
jgi:hypothetical protein